MRINEDYIDMVDPDDISDYSSLSMDVWQNVQWLLAGLTTNINLNLIQEPSYKVRDKKELKHLIRICIKKYGSKCNLNWIDVSGITDMSSLFSKSKFNGDISKWDVSNVKNMESMFFCAKFNGDISNWDVSSVTKMQSMFWLSKFNRDISRWDVSNVKNMLGMFFGTDFNQNISSWNTKNVTEFSYMFTNCNLKKSFRPKMMRNVEFGEM